MVKGSTIQKPRNKNTVAMIVDNNARLARKYLLARHGKELLGWMTMRPAATPLAQAEIGYKLARTMMNDGLRRLFDCQVFNNQLTHALIVDGDVVQVGELLHPPKCSKAGVLTKSDLVIGNTSFIWHRKCCGFSQGLVDIGTSSYGFGFRS